MKQLILRVVYVTIGSVLIGWKFGWQIGVGIWLISGSIIDVICIRTRK